MSSYLHAVSDVETGGYVTALKTMSDLKPLN